MTAIAPTFRLLDGLTGWDPRPDDGLEGVTIVGGALTLCDLPGASNAPEDRLPDLLAWDCRECTWWVGGTFGVRKLGPCDVEFVAWGTDRPVLALAAGDGLVVTLLAHGVGIVEIRNAERRTSSERRGSPARWASRSPATAWWWSLAAVG